MKSRLKQGAYIHVVCIDVVPHFPVFVGLRRQSHPAVVIWDLKTEKKEQRVSRSLWRSLWFLFKSMRLQERVKDKNKVSVRLSTSLKHEDAVCLLGTVWLCQQFVDDKSTWPSLQTEQLLSWGYRKTPAVVSAASWSHSVDSQARMLLYLFLVLLSGWLELSVVIPMSTVHAWTSYTHTQDERWESTPNFSTGRRSAFPPLIYLYPFVFDSSC